MKDAGGFGHIWAANLKMSSKSYRAILPPLSDDELLRLGRGAKNIALLPRCSATGARAAKVALSGLQQKSDLAREKLSCGLSEAP